MTTSNLKWNPSSIAADGETITDFDGGDPLDPATIEGLINHRLPRCDENIAARELYHRLAMDVRVAGGKTLRHLFDAFDEIQAGSDRWNATLDALGLPTFPGYQAQKAAAKSIEDAQRAIRIRQGSRLVWKGGVMVEREDPVDPADRASLDFRTMTLRPSENERRRVEASERKLAEQAAARKAEREADAQRRDEVERRRREAARPQWFGAVAATGRKLEPKSGRLG